MLQTLDLRKMDLLPLTDAEAHQIDGGSFWTWLTGGGFLAAVIGIAIASIPVLGAGIVAMSIGLAAEQEHQRGFQEGGQQN